MKKSVRLALIYLAVALLFYWSMGRQIREIMEGADDTTPAVQESFVPSK